MARAGSSKRIPKGKVRTRFLRPDESLGKDLILSQTAPPAERAVIEAANGTQLGVLFLFPQADQGLLLEGPYWTPEADPISGFQPLIDFMEREAPRRGWKRFETHRPIEGPETIHPLWNLAGFRRTCLVSLIKRFLLDTNLPAEAARDPLGLLPYDQTPPSLFSRVLMETLKESRDAVRFPMPSDPEAFLATLAPPSVQTRKEWFLARDAKQQPIGCLLLHLHPSEPFPLAEIRYLGVIPRARGKGWGKRIVARAIRLARGLEAGELWAGVDAENSPALRCYEANGFTLFRRNQILVKEIR
jgi:RimJ/RimL family protein N-acetyltransferase